MKVSRREFNGILTFGGLSGLFSNQSQTPTAQVWRSSVDRRYRLTPGANLRFGDLRGTAKGEVLIEVSPEKTYQKILGLGSSLEPTTCWNLSRLPLAQRKHWLSRIVSPTSGIGMNLMRICIGTPDFTGDPWYTYNDLPKGMTDPQLKCFSIEKDRRYILPILRLAKDLNPQLLFFASPWSPPGWMKSSGSIIGGSLLPQWYPAYAEYLVKFIKAYTQAGIPIYAMTIQNEPGVDRENEKDPKWFYPSCHWTAEQERDFLRDHLGPALKRNKLQTKVWSYDHNYNEKATKDDAGIDYPRTILKDEGAAKYVGGVAFHGYVGTPSGMSVLHREYPNVDIHFTEGSVFGINGARELIDRLRNHACSYNAWVTMLDSTGKPNNGPFAASKTVLTLNPATNEVTENFDFDMYGQFMKFITRGARRVESSEAEGDIINVAFRNPDGRLILVVANTGAKEKSLLIQVGKSGASMQMAGASIATLAINYGGASSIKRKPAGTK